MNLCDMSSLPPCKWDFHSSRMLHSVDLYLPTFRCNI